MELLNALKDKIAESSLVAGTEVSVSLEILRPGFRASPESLTVYVVPMVTGATDAGYAARAKNAVVLEGFGPSGQGIHSRMEYVEIDSLAPSLYQLTRLLIELGKRRGE